MRHRTKPFWFLICVLLAISAAAASGTMAAGPKPDPPPRPQPPPPPPPAPVYRAPPPPVFVQPPPPVSSGPTAAQIAASRAAAARAEADRLRAERAKKAAKAAARARKAKAAARKARLRDQRLRALQETAGRSAVSSKGLAAVPKARRSASVAAFAFGLLGAGVVLLGLALVPAYAVPWYRASRTLEARRGELALFGALGLFAAAFFLLQAG